MAALRGGAAGLLCTAERLVWPTTVVGTLLGALVGFACGVRMLTRPSKLGTFSWGLSHLWFGMMSLLALVTHSVGVGNPSQSLWDDLVVGEVAFASCAALCTAVALLVDATAVPDTSTDAHAVLLSVCMLVVFALGQLQASGEPWAPVVFAAIPLGSVALAMVAALGLLLASLRRWDRALAWLSIAVVVTATAATTVLAQARVCSSPPPQQASAGPMRLLGVEVPAGSEARVPALFWMYDLIVLALFESKCAQLRALELRSPHADSKKRQ